MAKPRHASLTGLATAARRVLPVALWGATPVLFTLWTAFRSRHAPFAGDFHYAFWPAGTQILHGTSPYVDPGSPAVAHAVAFVYPAIAGLLLAPFALIPHALADHVFAYLMLLATLATLRVLEVRDWRVYGAAVLCPAVFSGWTLGNITPVLGLCVALVWRYRDRTLVVGALTALAVSLKLFLWPLGLWLLATRRFAALRDALAIGLLLNALAWLSVGIGQIGRYGRLLHALAITEERRGYSVMTFMLRVGTSRQAAYATAAAASVALASYCVLAGRRGRELTALTIALGISLLATPIVQLHYFALLLIPFALAAPRLTLAWALPLAMWACSSPKHPWQIALALTLGASMVAVAARRETIGGLALWRRGPSAAAAPLSSSS